MTKTTIRRTKNCITRRTKHGNSTVITKHAPPRDDSNQFGATSADALPLSDEAALRAMLKLSPDGQAMLFAMMRFVADTCERQTVLEQAAKRARLNDDDARHGVLELIDASLLRRQSDGSMVLHKVFGSVAHQWRKKLRRGQRADNLVAFGGCPASEKLQIIRTVEASYLPVKPTLAMIGIPSSTYCDWYARWVEGGLDALADRSLRPASVWNRIPDTVREDVVDFAWSMRT